MTVSTGTAFEISEENGVAHLRLTRPEASNAMNAAFWTAFGPAITRLDRAGQTRALVISGEGRNFCAGMDLSAFAGAIPDTKTAADRQAFPALVHDLQEAFTALERARFPVIAAIQGACVGAGLELAAACDLRFAAADARFRVEEINIGMMADVGSLQRLPKLMPEGLVKELAFLGRTLTADRALAVGFVTEVHADAEAVVTGALAAAGEVAGKAPLAIAGSKAAIHYARDHSVADSLAWAGLAQAGLWNTGDIAKAIQARATKTVGEYEPLAAIPTMGK
ncbi:MAG: enoyl-CoA hydratase-related protein [Pseudomonadota bacterium]